MFLSVVLCAACCDVADGSWLLAFVAALTGCRCRATEMDVTMIGLQNAGKTSLLRVLAVSRVEPHGRAGTFLTDSIQGAEFAME